MQETSNTQKDLIDWEATATFIQCNMHIHPLTAVTSWPLFPDSDIAKKMSCGHTKSACIVTNVLAPVSVEKCIRELTFPILAGDKHKHPPFFSVASDASNHGSVKLFPLEMEMEIFFKFQLALFICQFEILV